jgi:Protein of unknown function (DUF4054)
MISLELFLQSYPEFAALDAEYYGLIDSVIRETTIEADSYNYLSDDPKLQDLALSLHVAHNCLSRSREIAASNGGAAGGFIKRQKDDLFGEVEYDTSAAVSVAQKYRNSPYWERLQQLLSQRSMVSVGFLAFGPSPYIPRRL